MKIVRLRHFTRERCGQPAGTAKQRLHQFNWIALQKIISRSPLLIGVSSVIKLTDFFLLHLSIFSLLRRGRQSRFSAHVKISLKMLVQVFLLLYFRWLFDLMQMRRADWNPTSIRAQLSYQFYAHLSCCRPSSRCITAAAATSSNVAVVVILKTHRCVGWFTFSRCTATIRLSRVEWLAQRAHKFSALRIRPIGPNTLNVSCISARMCHASDELCFAVCGRVSASTQWLSWIMERTDMLLCHAVIIIWVAGYRQYQ